MNMHHVHSTQRHDEPSAQRSAEEQARLVEQHAERAALARIRGVSFTHALIMQGVPGEITFPAPERARRGGLPGSSTTERSVILRGADLYDERVWHKFLASRSESVELTNLTAYADQLSREYAFWLVGKHTGRSRLLRHEQHLLWLEQVATLVVLRRMMEAKYHLMLRGGEGFADPWVARGMEDLVFIGLLTQETAKAVYRACRQREEAAGYLSHITTTLTSFLQNRPAVLRTDLPLLPQAKKMPGVLLAEPAQREHKQMEDS